MSAVEATATPVVEEAKPTETAPVTESSAAAEAPKVEDVATPVRFLCWFLCVISFFLTSFLFSFFFP